MTTNRAVLFRAWPCACGHSLADHPIHRGSVCATCPCTGFLPFPPLERSEKRVARQSRQIERAQLRFARPRTLVRLYRKFRG